MWRNPKLPGIVQPVTGRHACDGPSRWPSHLPQNPIVTTDSVTVRHTCDGPSCTSVMAVRNSFPVPNSQKLKCFATGLTTVRRGCDGTSCRSVTIYRESIFSTRFSNSKCHGTEHPRRSVEPVTVRRWVRGFSQFFQN